MSNYTKTTNFTAKDALSPGNPSKVIKGSEFDTEFDAIATAVATKANSTSPTLVTPVLGTPSSGTLTNCTGLPISTGVSGLGTGVADFLATPSSANLRAALTDETGSGAAVFATSPTLVTPVLGTPSSGTLTNCTGLPISTGVSGLGANVAAFLATPSSANLRSALTDETGTGAAVFADSPTLVTPALGTPASGNLANCTGFPSAVGTHLVEVHSGNGHGSTNNKIRRFSTTVTNTGTAITYADSAANGASFTINDTGIYAITYGDLAGASTCAYGVSVNSGQLTTAIGSITAGDRKLYVNIGGVSGGVSFPGCRVLKLTAGDIVRPHTDGNTDNTATACNFTIQKISTMN